MSTRAPTPLAVYLEHRQIGSAAFADTLGVEQSTVWRWRAGERVPNLELAVAVEGATDGEVTVEEWAEWIEKERKRLAALKASKRRRA